MDLHDLRTRSSTWADVASRHRVRLAGAFAGVIALGTMLHAIGNKGLWGDEIWQVWWSVQKPLGSMLTQVWAPPDLPLNFFLVRFATTLGTDPASVGLPEAILGVGTVLIVFALGYRAFGLWVGVAAAILLAVAPLQVWYAQEARPYAGLSFYSVLALYCFVRLLDHWSWLAWIGLVLAFTLDIYNHLFGLFPVGVLMLVAPAVPLGRAIRRAETGRPFAPALSFADLLFVGRIWAAGVASALLSFPLWSGIADYLRVGGPGEVAPPPFILTPGFIGDQLALYGAGAGWRLYLFAGLFVIGLVVAAMRRPSMALLIGVWISVPFIALAVLQPRHIFIPRYFLFLQPVYLLTVSLGVVVGAQVLGFAVGHLRPSRSGGARTFLSLAAIVGLCLVTFRTTLVGYRVDKPQDWGSLCSFLATNAQPGDVVTGNSYARDALRWCLAGMPEFYIPGRDEGLDDLFDSRQNVWFVQTADGLGAPPLASNGFAAIPDNTWTRPDLIKAGDYRSFAFPVSETGVHLYYRPAPELPTHVVLHDVIGSTVVAGWPDYGQIGPNEVRSLAIARVQGASRLAIRSLDAPGRDLDVWIDHVRIGAIPTGDGDGAWTTTFFTIPAWAGPLMQLELHDLGGQPAAVAEVRTGP